jgi:hypothetical protein
MRWRAERSAKAKGWTITLAELQRWTLAYAIVWPNEITPA